MIIQTEKFGELNVDEDKIIEFPDALPGFPNLKKFTLLHRKDRDGNDLHTFAFLQSIENTDIALALIDVSYYLTDYTLNLNDDDLDIIGGFSPEDTLIYNVMVVPEKLEDIRTNLKAPIVINSITRKGKQIVMEGDYDIRFHIYKMLKEKVGE